MNRSTLNQFRQSTGFGQGQVRNEYKRSNDNMIGYNNSNLSANALGTGSFGGMYGDDGLFSQDFIGAYNPQPAQQFQQVQQLSPVPFNQQYVAPRFNNVGNELGGRDNPRFGRPLAPPPAFPRMRPGVTQGSGTLSQPKPITGGYKPPADTDPAIRPPVFPKFGG